MNKEWIRFVPGKEWIGLHARFRKVITKAHSAVMGVADVEEVEGTIVADLCPNAWCHDVEVVADEDGRRLPFANGKAAFWDDKDGNRHYMGEDFNVEYYYQEI